MWAIEFAAFVHGSPQLTAAVAIGLILFVVLALQRLLRSRGNSVGVDPNRTEMIAQPQARRIYERKMHFMPSISTLSDKSKYSKIRKEQEILATQFGVKRKVIEDIWNRKTWVSATSHMWADERAAP
jgi:hypothetical protein